MIFQTHIPKSPLDQFVESFIYHESYNPSHSIDRFLPDGNVEIIIDLDDKPKFIYDNETLRKIQTCQNGWASGVRSEPISIHSGKESAMLVINFKKGLAYPFFSLPMNEIADSVVDADLLWGNSFAVLRERLLETKDITHRFLLTEDFLLKNLQTNLSINPCVEYAVNEIIQNPDQINLGTLNKKIGYSQKHFISMFKKKVGITPKAYLKIMRFQKAISEIERLKEIDWTQLSQNCGFYDQAHFINDFRLLSGFTPEQYLSMKNQLLNYVPVV